MVVIVSSWVLVFAVAGITIKGLKYFDQLGALAALLARTMG